MGELYRGGRYHPLGWRNNSFHTVNRIRPARTSISGEINARAGQNISRTDQTSWSSKKYTFPGSKWNNRHTATGETLLPPPQRPGRKIVVLGDTSDASKLIKLSQNANVIIHEATNAYIPQLDKDATYETTEARTISRGHSTPQMAGKFAKACSAKVLLLNHFSA